MATSAPERSADPAAWNRLVTLYGYNRDTGEGRWTTSYPDFADIREQSRSFREMGASWRQQSNLTGKEGEPQRLDIAAVSHDLFPMLGMRTVIGRRITAVDDPYLPVHYPTINLLPFLQGDERWVSAGICQTADQQDHASLRKLARYAFAQVGQRADPRERPASHHGNPTERGQRRCLSAREPGRNQVGERKMNHADHDGQRHHR